MRGVVGVAVETFQIYFVARYKVTCCAYSFVPHNSARWCHRGGGITKRSVYQVPTALRRHDHGRIFASCGITNVQWVLHVCCCGMEMKSSGIKRLNIFL